MAIQSSKVHGIQKNNSMAIQENISGKFVKNCKLIGNLFIYISNESAYNSEVDIKKERKEKKKGGNWLRQHTDVYGT